MNQRPQKLQLKAEAAIERRLSPGDPPQIERGHKAQPERVVLHDVQMPHRPTTGPNVQALAALNSFRIR